MFVVLQAVLNAAGCAISPLTLTVGVWDIPIALMVRVSALFGDNCRRLVRADCRSVSYYLNEQLKA